VCLAALAGASFGVLSGYVGGRVDAAVMQAVNVVLSFPAVLMALLLVALVGQGGTNLMLAIGLQAVPGYIRLVRGLVLSVRGHEYVEPRGRWAGRPVRTPRCTSCPMCWGRWPSESTFLVAAAVHSPLGAELPRHRGCRRPRRMGAILAGGRNYLNIAPTSRGARRGVARGVARIEPAG
jgi:peptide/nickel transport system permease protein